MNNNIFIGLAILLFLGGVGLLIWKCSSEQYWGPTKYAYSYVDSTGEGEKSSLSAVIEDSGDKKNPTINVTSDSKYQIKLYRTNDNGKSYKFLSTLDKGVSSYKDTDIPPAAPKDCQKGGVIYDRLTSGDNNPTCGQLYEWVQSHGGGGWEKVVCHSPGTNADTQCKPCYPGCTPPSPPQSGYKLNIPSGDNYLNIHVDPKSENNYFIIIGDWGASPPGGYMHDSRMVQKVIAEELKNYVKDRKSEGKNLLFIATVGDNFYPVGLDCKQWEYQWKDVYGELATDYIWLAIMGNHDWGNTDPSCICPDNDPDKKVINDQSYKCNQLNVDKGGCRPDGIKGYHMPDFSYNYRIDDLNFEFIAMSNGFIDCPNGLGGNGEDGGAVTSIENCGGVDKTCRKLWDIRQAGMDLILDRAKNSPAKNVIITNHYSTGSSGTYAGPEPVDHGNACKELRDHFTQNSSTQNQTVMCAGGHDHAQGCHQTDNDAGCLNILSGGGGGCCSPDVSAVNGFYVVKFDENRNMKSENVGWKSLMSGNQPPKHVHHPPDSSLYETGWVYL
jgi:hypothetical protein